MQHRPVSVQLHARSTRRAHTRAPGCKATGRGKQAHTACHLILCHTAVLLRQTFAAQDEPTQGHPAARQQEEASNQASPHCLSPGSLPPSCPSLQATPVPRQTRAPADKWTGRSLTREGHPGWPLWCPGLQQLCLLPSYTPSSLPFAGVLYDLASRPTAGLGSEGDVG
jgi:hypothetical protein